MFKNTNGVNCAKIVVSLNCRDVKHEVFEKFFFLLYVFGRETEKQTKKRKRAPKNYKICVFEVVIQKWEKSKNGFLAKIVWHYLCQKGRKNTHFRAHYLFWPKILGTKTVKTRKIINIVVSAEEIAQPKNDTLFLKKVFLAWVKKWVLLTVFVRSCVLLKTQFIVFSATHSNCKKTACWKARKFMTNSVLFWTWQKGVFLRLYCYCGWFLCLVKLQ